MTVLMKQTKKHFPTIGKTGLQRYFPSLSVLILLTITLSFGSGYGR